MKQIKYINLLLLIMFFASCEKHVVDYDTYTLTENTAEYQLHYFVPVPSAAANNIYKVEVNDDVVTTNAATLVTYNAIPSGGVGRFATVAPGTVNIKLYQLTNPSLPYSDANLTKVYDQNTQLQGGKKQNIFVYDFTQPPIVFDNGYPYISDRRPYDTDTIAYVKFYNFMFETTDVPTTMKLQYQYQYILHPLYTLEDAQKGVIPEGKKVGDATGDTKRSAWLNIGNPLAFGETTGWQEVVVKKTSYIAQGSATIYYRIVVSAENGGVPGVTVMDSNDWVLRARTNASNVNTYNAYSYSTSLTIGRRQHHTIGGQRAGGDIPGVADPIIGIKLFTAL
ncbi:MAG: hypothetical protein LBN98_04050 [Prevotellaceae bacterium]|jgi:hypothetical protein|nr:hypothetical protein [Prevotellaceae bacterium]